MASDRPVVRARDAAGLQLKAFLVVGVVTALIVAVRDQADLVEWIGAGLVSPLIIAAALIVLGRPRRRVQGPTVERPPQARLATGPQAGRLTTALVVAWLGLAAVAVLAGGADKLLIVTAASLGHVAALAVLWAWLGRLEDRVGAPLYQRLDTGIWRQPLYAWREPGSADPAVLAALGRRAAP